MNPQGNIHPNATGTGHTNSFNVINSFNNIYLVDEKPRLLEWLSPLEPRVRHQDVRTNRLDGVGEWLLQSDEFVNWRDGRGGSDALLFCSGAPGVGKTYLSSLVIDTLCDQSVRQKAGVACFYYDFQYQKIQTPENILGALVKQLIRGLGVIPSEIDDAFQKAKGQVGGRGLRVDELLPILQVALAPLEQAFICIDALDECLGKYLPELLRSLHTISQWSPKIRLFITGRPHIQREIEKHFPGSTQLVQITPTMEDIMKYLQMMLDNDSEPEAMNADLKAEIMKRVSESISDVFLLVSLNIAAILAEVTIYGRREQLKRMTSGLGLGDAYRVALDRIEAQGGAKSRLGMAALMWISRSERPMTADELCHALGVQIGSTDLNPESIPSIQTLLASCLGLVTLDKTGSTVRLVHLTLQEYLDSHHGIFRNPYAAMAEVCLTYLNYDCVNMLLPDLDSAPPTTPLLQYASRYWGPYARNETTESVKSLALPLLCNFDSHISAKLLLRQCVSLLVVEPGSQPEGFTGLHCVAYLGTDEIASALLQIKGSDINRVDFMGRTPLIWAAEYGHEGIMKLFMKKKDLMFQAKDERGRTALSWAAGSGNEEIVKLLLDREELSVESRDNGGRTPLSHAAWPGSEGVVKLFLERREVNAESRDGGGRTPLSYAAQGGIVKAVELFLEREEVDPESRDNDGRTPLSHAAWSGKEGVVELFLARGGVNPESRDNGGRTPLAYAAWSGNGGAVKLFLERKEVNAESQDNGGRTPLSYAAQGENVEAVELLLELEGVNAESRDNSGRTPLSYAVSYGQETVKLFLKREEVNPESRDNGGRTPLSRAAAAGNGGVVKLFLEREGVNVESRDNRGRTPLSHAAQYGGETVVKLFLEREDVSIESRDNGGRTPVSYAAGSRKAGVVKLFLEREDVNTESQDNGGRTPLSYAASSGDEDAVRLFLERGEANVVDSQDNDGRTPLSHAAECWDEGVVKLFLSREAVNTESRDNGSRTPFSYAAGSGVVPIVKLFLERKEINTESQDSDGRTPLFFALQNRSKKVGKMLLARREVNPRSPALFEDEEVAQLLRECLDAIPATQQHGARTPKTRTNKDNQEAEPLVQPPLQAQDADTNTPQEGTQYSSLATLPTDDPYQNFETHTQDSKLYPLASPVVHLVPPAAVAPASLEPSLQTPPRSISRALQERKLWPYHVKK